MRVLIFRHVPFEGAGYLEDLMRERGIAFDYADLWRDEVPLPCLTDYQALLIMGGPMSANDAFPYLLGEMQYIGEAFARGMPILGICLGAQLIAKAMGASVRRNVANEIGWFDLRFTDAAKEDLLFGGLQRETVFHWHGETFELPSGAELLASSELCINQAFRIGRHVYGLQFHLEVTPEMIADWCQQDDNCGDVRELSAPLDANYNSDRLRALAARVLGGWCDIVAAAR
jgi:GMP synthase (glutamine-hydrolysing)